MTAGVVVLSPKISKTLMIRLLVNPILRALAMLKTRRTSSNGVQGFRGGGTRKGGFGENGECGHYG